MLTSSLRFGILASAGSGAARHAGRLVLESVCRCGWGIGGVVGIEVDVVEVEAWKRELCGEKYCRIEFLKDLLFVRQSRLSHVFGLVVMKMSSQGTYLIFALGIIRRAQTPPPPTRKITSDSPSVAWQICRYLNLPLQTSL